jgi:two-component system chemotaxis response regulator CheY
MATHNRPAGKSEHTKRVVLVVDSEDWSLSRLSILLARFDCRPVEATGAYEALAKAAELTPSLIIASADLPGMNMLEFIRRVRTGAKTAHIPVVGLLSAADRDFCEACMKQGAAGCVFRPVEPEALYRAVEEAHEKNARKMLRVRTVVPVKVHGAQHDALYGAYTLALSQGGMFLHTMNPVSVNSKLSLEFDLNGLQISAGSVVIYNCQAGCGPDEETGIGLRFIDISPDDRNRISDFVRNEVMKGVSAADSR